MRLAEPKSGVSTRLSPALEFDIPYAARCSLSNRPVSSPAGRPRISFSAGYGHEHHRKQSSSKARKPRSPSTPGQEAALHVPSVSQGEVSAKSQFDLLVSRRAASHTAVQAAWQPAEVNTATKGRTRSPSPLAARTPSPLSLLTTTPAADMLLGAATPDMSRQGSAAAAQMFPSANRPHTAKEAGPVCRRPEGPVCYWPPGLARYRSPTADSPRFRSEAVALEVSVKEQLHQLELDFPASADKHRERQRLQLARRTMQTLHNSPALASDGLLAFLQHEYESAIATTARDAEQCSSATAGLAKANWRNSNLKQQVEKLQGRMSESDSLTARLKRELLLMKAKAEALEFSVAEKDAEIELLHERQDRQHAQMIQLMNDKEVLLGSQSRQGTPRSGQEDTAQTQQASISIPTTPASMKARMANENTFSCDDIREMDDATFLASLYSHP